MQEASTQALAATILAWTKELQPFDLVITANWTSALQQTEALATVNQRLMPHNLYLLIEPGSGKLHIFTTSKRPSGYTNCWKTRTQ